MHPALCRCEAVSVKKIKPREIKLVRDFCSINDLILSHQIELDLVMHSSAQVVKYTSVFV